MECSFKTRKNNYSLTLKKHNLKIVYKWNITNSLENLWVNYILFSKGNILKYYIRPQIFRSIFKCYRWYFYFYIGKKNSFDDLRKIDLDLYKSLVYIKDM